MRSRVIVLAGPSGAGKSRLAERLGLPVLRLDDFYRADDDPDLPRLTEGADAGMVDWDDPRSWHRDAAVNALRALCRDGRADVPDYSIPHNRAIGHRTLDVTGHDFFVAEGIFAAEVVAPCRQLGLLAAAYCVRQHPLVTFWRRLTRDLREHRKSPPVLVRRGVALLRAQQQVVAHAVSRGCLAVTPHEGHDAIMALVSTSTSAPRPGPWARELLTRRLAQPDQRSCGAVVLVAAEALANERYARNLVGGRLSFTDEVLAMHRRTTGTVDVGGRLQPPWPRRLGTPPWSVARQLTSRTGVAHRVRPVLPWRRRAAVDRIRAAVVAGRPVPLYVGTKALPRHVLLVVEAGPGPREPLTVLDPATGRTRRLPFGELAAGRLSTGWPVPWFAVLPRR